MVEWTQNIEMGLHLLLFLLALGGAIMVTTQEQTALYSALDVKSVAADAFCGAFGILCIALGRFAFDNKRYIGFNILGYGLIISQFTDTINTLVEIDQDQTDSDVDTIKEGSSIVAVAGMLSLLLVLLWNPRADGSELLNPTTTSFRSQPIWWQGSYVFSFLLAVIGAACWWAANDDADGETDAYEPSHGVSILLALITVPIAYGFGSAAAIGGVAASIGAIFMSAVGVLTTNLPLVPENVADPGDAYDMARAGMWLILIAVTILIPLMLMFDYDVIDAGITHKQVEDDAFEGFVSEPYESIASANLLTKIRLAVIVLVCLICVGCFIALLDINYDRLTFPSPELKQSMRITPFLGLISLVLVLAAFILKRGIGFMIAYAMSAYVFIFSVFYARSAWLVNTEDDAASIKNSTSEKLFDTYAAFAFFYVLSLLAAYPNPFKTYKAYSHPSPPSTRLLELSLPLLLIVLGSGLVWGTIEDQTLSIKAASNVTSACMPYFIFFGAMIAIVSNSMMAVGGVLGLLGTSFNGPLEQLLQELPELRDENPGEVKDYDSWYSGYFLIFVAYVVLALLAVFRVTAQGPTDQYGAHQSDRGVSSSSNSNTNSNANTTVV